MRAASKSSSSEYALPPRLAQIELRRAESAPVRRWLLLAAVATGLGLVCGVVTSSRDRTPLIPGESGVAMALHLHDSSTALHLHDANQSTLRANLVADVVPLPVKAALARCGRDGACGVSCASVLHWHLSRTHLPAMLALDQLGAIARAKGYSTLFLTGVSRTALPAAELERFASAHGFAGGVVRFGSLALVSRHEAVGSAERAEGAGGLGEGVGCIELCGGELHLCALPMSVRPSALASVRALGADARALVFTTASHPTDLWLDAARGGGGGVGAEEARLRAHLLKLGFAQLGVESAEARAVAAARAPAAPAVDSAYASGALRRRVAQGCAAGGGAKATTAAAAMRAVAESRWAGPLARVSVPLGVDPCATARVAPAAPRARTRSRAEQAGEWLDPREAARAAMMAWPPERMGARDALLAARARREPWMMASRRPLPAAARRPPLLPPTLPLSDAEAAALQPTLSRLWRPLQTQLSGAPRAACEGVARLRGLAELARMLGSAAHVRRCQLISGVLIGLQPAEPTRAARLGSCAVVGGSGVLAVHAHGPRIESHAHVFRVNGCPVRGLEAQVGARTSVRFVNAPQSGRWLQDVERTGRLPAELNETDLALLWVNAQAVARLRVHSRGRPLIHALSNRFRTSCVNRIFSQQDRERHLRLNKVRALEITFGFEALMHALYSCETVTVFGFYLSASDRDARGQARAGAMGYPYHYWENATYDRSAKDPYRPWTYPYHNFELEEEKLRDMRRACLIERFVTDVPGELPV
jgi:hypothetical protein